MNANKVRRKSSWGGCSQCAAGEKASEPPDWAGRRLVLAAAGMFLAPLVLAVAGALAGGGRPVAGLLGAVGGLAVGAILAVVVARVARRMGKEAA